MWGISRKSTKLKPSLIIIIIIIIIIIFIQVSYRFLQNNLYQSSDCFENFSRSYCRNC